MGHEKLISGYRKVVHTIYSPKHYYARVRKIPERELSLLRKKHFHFSTSHLEAGFKSIFHPRDNRKGKNLLLEAFFFWSLFRPAAAFSACDALTIYGFRPKDFQTPHARSSIEGNFILNNLQTPEHGSATKKLVHINGKHSDKQDQLACHAGLSGILLNPP